MKNIRLAVFGLAFASLAALGACAPQPGAIEGYRALDGLIAFDAPVLKSVQPKRVTHVNSIQRQEYARFEGAGATAEVVLVQARHFFLENVSLNFPQTTENVIGLWNAFKGKDIKMAKAVWYHPELAGFWYRPFSAASGPSCIAFTSEWDIHAADEKLRPDMALLGYYCAPKGQALGPVEAEKVIDTIGVAGVNKSFRGNSLELAMAPDPNQQEPLARLVRGASASGGGAGTDYFPFNMAEVYTIHGGCSGTDC